jgi:hypothetical protein
MGQYDDREDGPIFAGKTIHASAAISVGPNPSVATAIDRLDSALERLVELEERYTHRLQPVLHRRNDEPVMFAQDGGTPDQPHSDLQIAINERADRANEIANRLERTFSRIDL